MMTIGNAAIAALRRVPRLVPPFTGMPATRFATPCVHRPVILMTTIGKNFIAELAIRSAIPRFVIPRSAIPTGIIMPRLAIRITPRLAIPT